MHFVQCQASERQGLQLLTLTAHAKRVQGRALHSLQDPPTRLHTGMTEHEPDAGHKVAVSQRGWFRAMQNIQRHKGPTVQTGVRPLRWKDSKTRGGTSVFAQNTWHLGLCETAIKHKGLVGAAESCCTMGYLHEKLLMEREEAITSSVYSVLRKPALHLVLQV